MSTGAAQYAIFQWVGCSHTSSWSPQKRLYVVRGSKPRISLSSWIRKENVETDVPMKNLPSNTVVTCPAGHAHRHPPPAACPAWALGAPWQSPGRVALASRTDSKLRAQGQASGPGQGSPQLQGQTGPAWARPETPAASWPQGRLRATGPVAGANRLQLPTKDSGNGTNAPEARPPGRPPDPGPRAHRTQALRRLSCCLALPRKPGRVAPLSPQPRPRAVPTVPSTRSLHKGSAQVDPSEPDTGTCPAGPSLLRTGKQAGPLSLPLSLGVF